MSSGRGKRSAEWVWLRQDSVSRLALLALPTIVLLYLIPLLFPLNNGLVSRSEGLLVVLACTVWSLQHRLQEVQAANERWFWHLVTAGLFFWIVATGFLSLRKGPWFALDLSLLLVYLSFIIASELRPDLGGEHRPTGLARRIQLIALGLFIFCLLAYLSLTANQLPNEDRATWTPSTYLYIVLDIYIVTRFTYLWRVANGSRWKMTYALIATCAGLWVASDTLLHLRYVPDLDLYLLSSSPWDFLWYCSFPPLILAARLRHAPLQKVPEPNEGQTVKESPQWVALIAYTFLLPFLHLIFQSFGLVTPALQRQQNLLILGYLTSLGLLLMLQHRTFEAEKRLLKVQHSEALEAKQLADAANLAKSKFLAEMSHDIRTPMSSVIGISRFLLKAGLPPREHQYAQIIKSSAEGLLQLIDEILDLSKIEAGKLSLENVDFRLRDTGNEVMELLAPRATAKGVVLRFEVAQELPVWMRGDPWRLRQVLYNLVGNAIKFTPQGSVVVRAEQSQRRVESGTAVRFLVRDTGVGIPERVKTRLFTPFTSTTRRSGGSGLGLANCKKIVELMGGEIRVESTPGLGSTFWFTVPFGESQHGSQSQRETESHGSDARRRGLRRRCRILVAEDEWVNRLIVEGVLEDLGYSVDSVTNGLEAMEALESEQYDLVLMDCQMPELDGYEATRRIRRGEVGEHLPILALTASAMKDEQQRCRAAGMDDFIPKPYSEAELAAVVDRWLLNDETDLDDGAEEVEAETSTGLDPSYLATLRRLRCDPDTDLLTQLATEFLAQAPGQMCGLRESLARDDREELAAVAHRLTGSSGALGAFHLAALLKELQRCAHEEAPARCHGAVRDAERELQRVQQELQELVAERSTAPRQAPDRTASSGSFQDR